MNAAGERRVLETLAERPQWYVRDLATEAGVGPGDIYPLLARLEGLGVVESEWSGSRRSYRLRADAPAYSPVEYRRFPDTRSNGWLLALLGCLIFYGGLYFLGGWKLVAGVAIASAAIVIMIFIRDGR